MARVIHSSFRSWLLNLIESTGGIMIRSRQRTYEVGELYSLLVPDPLVRGTLTAAAEYLRQEEGQGFNHKIWTHFSNGFKINMPYHIMFRGINLSQFNHILLPWECDPLTIDSSLGKDMIPLSVTAIEWSQLHYVVDHILTNIATDPRSIGVLFPWCKPLIQTSAWNRERGRFRIQQGLDTKREQELCDATFSAALGEGMNVPPLTDRITKITLSGDRLFSQAKMLMGTPGWKDKSFSGQTTIAPYIIQDNVPEIIHKHIKDITEFVNKRKQ